MARIPAPAAVTGCLALVPFLWGALTMTAPDIGAQVSATLGARFVGPYVQLFWGSVTLALFSGALFGFTARSDDRDGARPATWIAAGLPAIWAFIAPGGGPAAAAGNLAAGHVGILLIDRWFARTGLAPDWWMPARYAFAAIAVLCLLPLAVG